MCTLSFYFSIMYIRIYQFIDRCNFETPLGGAGTRGINDDPALSTILGTIVINIDNQITASLAIQVDGLSIVVVAYSKNSGTSHFAGFVSFKYLPFQLIKLIRLFSISFELDYDLLCV